VIRLAKRYTTWAENPSVPLPYYVGTFFAFVTLRNWLEILSDRTEVCASVHVHYYLFHLCMAMSLALLISAMTSQPAQATLRLVLSSYFLVLLAPVLDLLLSGGRGYDMTYLLPERHSDLVLRYFTIGGSWHEGGITPGMKLETLVVLGCSYVYSRSKGLTWLRGLTLIVAMYSVGFGYALLPFLLRGAGRNTEALFTKFYLIAGALLLVALVWRWHRESLVAAARRARPYRQIHAVLMVTLGVVLALPFAQRDHLAFDIALIALATISGCLCLVALSDRLGEGERMRGTEGGTGPGAEAGSEGALAAGLGVLSVALAAAVEYYIAFLVLVPLALYALYSLPPLRLKRRAVVSKLPVALGSLACVQMGYVFAGSGPLELPPPVMIWFAVPFFLATNLIDLKDYEEDKRQGIKTLVVRWGLERSKLAIGLFVFLGYVSAPLVFDQPALLLPGIAAGAIQWLLITRQRYQERWSFLLYLTSLGVLIGALIGRTG
jgi:1,4-dihydroxy-2-naphthoate octaprenyltransferase